MAPDTLVSGPRQLTRLIVLSVFFLAPLFGCGGCREGKTSDGYEVPGGPFGDVLSSLCDTLDRCPQAFGSTIAYRSNDECTAILNFVMTCRLTREEVGNDTTVYGVARRMVEVDEERARTCIEWIDAAECGQFANLGGAGGPCDGVLQQGSFDDDDDDGGNDATLGKLNEPCSYYEECQPELYCAGGGTDVEAGIFYCEVCRERLDVGDACAGDQCKQGLYCKGTQEMTDFKCAPVEDDGFRCYQDNQCKSGWCNQTLEESGGWGQCDPEGEVGDACTEPYDCRENLFCAEDSTCQNRRPNGSPCTDSVACEHFNCDLDTEVCGAADGATCDYDEQCAASLCISQTCGNADGACRTTADCEGGEFCSGGCNPPECGCSGDGCPVGVCMAGGQGGGSCESDNDCPNNGECEDGSCVGGVQIGDACSENYERYPYQCLNGACGEKADPGEECGALDSCKEPFLCIEGRCEMMNLNCEPASAGQRCAWLRVCDDDAYCDLFDNVTCKPKTRLGEECQTTHIRGTQTCEKDAVCVYDETSETQRCVRAGAAGEACVGGQCEEGSFCYEGTCEPDPAGRPCSDWDEDAPKCPDGYRCSDDVCLPKAPQGAECNDHFDCEDGLFCENHRTCEERRSAGVECNEHSECEASLFCSRDTWTCATRLARGADCSNSDTSCAVGTYCTNGVCEAAGAAGDSCSDDRECASGVCYGRDFCLADAECVMP